MKLKMTKSKNDLKSVRSCVKRCVEIPKSRVEKRGEKVVHEGGITKRFCLKIDSEENEKMKFERLYF